MVRTTALLALLAPVAAGAKTKPWVPHPIHVVPGVPLKAEDIKPYVPPKLAPEPELEASDVKTVEVTAPEAVIEIRPWSSPMVGNAMHGSRLPVRGVVKATRGGCSSKVWYAIDPFGYLCGHEAKPTAEAPSTESVLKVRENSRLPFQYVMALVPEGVKIPMWATVDDMKKGNEPERQLEKGDTVAIEKELKWEDGKYFVSVDGKVIPQKGFSMMGGGSHWHGIDITEADLPFGWITAEKANVYAAAPQKGEKPKPAMTLARRTRVKIVDEVEQNKRAKWLKVTVVDQPPEETTGDIIANVSTKKAPAKTEAAAPAAPEAPPTEMWVSADAVNEVRHLDRPKTIPEGVTKWIDVDLGEQVLVLYQDDKPIYATLVSSGRAIATPMGTYPVWAKVSAITMKNQPYEDKEYFVNKVPWSTFFQWHNAIHGAYWHDRFGVTKSHGCVNVAPMDAKHVFEWVEPPLAPGWTGLRPLELLKSPTVVTRNSHMAKQFRQDRPIGPPDRQLEAERVVEADQRRADEAQAAAAAAAQAPTDPAVVPAAIQTPPPAPKQ
jgi:lipoprotein-anchoring transpeptidase ErfK/SrfK